MYVSSEYRINIHTMSKLRFSRYEHYGRELGNAHDQLRCPKWLMGENKGGALMKEKTSHAASWVCKDGKKFGLIRHGEISSSLGQN